MNRLWKMVREEPYRVFFPLGMIAGMVGVMMWPMWYAHWLGYYPNEAHTRMMIECFMGAFVAGFIGTAFPRLAGNRPWFGVELSLILVLWLLSAASHATGRVAAGDAAFCAMMAVIFLGMAGRWLLGNRDTPPPGFILSMTGILGACVAAGFLAQNAMPGTIAVRCAKLFLFQGFLLLPLMGIGPYVLPRFFGMSSSHSFDDSPRPPAGWWLLVAKAGTAGLLLLASFAMELMESTMAGQLLRAGVVAAWFILETPLLRTGKLSSTPGNTVRWALIGLITGITCAAFTPQARVGSLHLFFASGLGLFTLAVGARVVLGHAGRHDLLIGKIVWLRWVVGLVVLAAFTRLTADFLPKVRISHQIYAAWTWALAACIWLLALARFFLRHEDSPVRRSQCPRRRGKTVSMESEHP
jgi:uncharacterized protein involved in response to NO